MGIYIDSKGISLRASFITDPEGKIITYEIHDETIGRNISELLRKLEAAVAIRNNQGSFCPVNWHEGDELLKAE